MKSFINKTTITSFDLERLCPLLRNWQVLNARFKSAQPLSVLDLDMLITLERQGSNRRHILDRLTARYGRECVRTLREQLHAS